MGKSERALCVLLLGNLHTVLEGNLLFTTGPFMCSATGQFMPVLAEVLAVAVRVYIRVRKLQPTDLLR